MLVCYFCSFLPHLRFKEGLFLDWIRDTQAAIAWRPLSNGYPCFKAKPNQKPHKLVGDLLSDLRNVSDLLDLFIVRKYK